MFRTEVMPRMKHALYVRYVLLVVRGVEVVKQNVHFVSCMLENQQWSSDHTLPPM